MPRYRIIATRKTEATRERLVQHARFARRADGAQVLACLLVLAPALRAAAQWPQFGGPQRNFIAQSGPLADQWPAQGPPEVWSREIGPGHSSIVLVDGVLYTMCRRGEQDAVLAMRAEDGATIWETRYDAPPRPDMALEFGPGPHATPLVVGDRVFTLGAMLHFHCLDRKTGDTLWSHNLSDLLGTGDLMRGYGASAVAYRDLVIVNTGPGRGGDGPGVTAFRQDTGEIVWKSAKFSGGYASPLIVRFNNEDHLIVALGADRAGLDPATGATRWQLTVDSQSYGIMSTPVWVEPDKLFCSAGYGGGSRLIRLTFADGAYAAEECWHYRKMQVSHGSIVCVGDFAYACSGGSFDPAFLMAIDLRTGKPAWRERGFAKANVLYADGKLIILDERGTLALATATPERLTIRARADNVLQEKSWTCPTLVGTRLYLRDHHTIMAVELGRDAPAADRTAAASSPRARLEE